MKNKERSRHGFTINPYCHCCLRVVEDLDHVFRRYSKIIPVWENLNVNTIDSGAQKKYFKNWIQWNLTSENWKVTFACCRWWIWRWRNDRVFKNTEHELLWVYILKLNYELVYDLRKWEASCTQEMDRKPDFSANRWICPPPYMWTWDTFSFASN